jgi:RNA polymerase sigma-70 factor (ECF subfamily)
MPSPRKDFSKIYDKYIDKIYRFVYFKVNSRPIAEDLCSETFLRGWEAFKKGKNPDNEYQEIENPPAFLYQIARNLIIDYYREKGKAKIVSAEETPMEDPRMNLEEKAALNSEMETVRLALSNLKDDYQDLIIWHYLEGFSVDEIAQMVGKSEGAVRVQLHRALKSLQDELNEEQII